jgi:hypothetical protein
MRLLQAKGHRKDASKERQQAPEVTRPSKKVRHEPGQAHRRCDNRTSLPGDHIAKRRAAAVVTVGAHHEHQNGLNVIYDEWRVNTDFHHVASFSRIVLQ